MHRRHVALALASAIDCALVAVGRVRVPSRTSRLPGAGEAAGPAAPLTSTLGHKHGSEANVPVANTSVNASVALHPNVSANEDSRPAENGDRQPTQPHNCLAERLP